MSEGNGTAPGSGSAESGQEDGPSTEMARGLSLGRYVVLGRLGAGGMGVVYGAYDPELDRKVAIKLLRADRELGAAADRGNRLLQEAKALAGLSHQNVVTVHDVGTFLGQVFIAMEFISGGTLSAWLRTSPPWREVLRCFIQAGEGLAAAHGQGLVHRDFKPDNVLLDANRQPRVTDFGLARKGEVPAVAASDAKSGRVAGTIGFLAPEQARRKVVDARSDQFSFCLSLYLGLYGDSAFAKDVDLLQPLPPVRAAPKDSKVPGWVRKVLIKGLSEDPSARFASMRELLTALEADPARARRELVGRGLALALLATVVTLGVLFLQRETPEQRSQAECLARVDSQLDSIWSTQRRAQIEQNFGNTSKEIGPQSWARVHDLLNPELDDWHRTSMATCVLRGDPAVRAQWASCLEEHRKTLQSLSDLFVSADASVIPYAENTILVEVTPASACKSISPSESATMDGSSASDEGMRSGLARARVLRAAGKLVDGIGEARDVANEARRQKARHVEAEAMLLVGEMSGELHRLTAEQDLREAIVAADRVGNDEIRARAWISLVSWYSDAGRLEDSQRADSQARALLHRLGNPPLLLAAQLMAAGRLADAQGDSQGSLTDFEQALKIRQSLLKKGHPSLEKALTNVGNSLPAEQGLPLLSEVLTRRESVFGFKHPETGIAHHNVGIALRRQNDCPGALAHFNAALEIRLEDPSADRSMVGREHASLGGTLACLQRLDEAETSHRRAVSLLKESGAPAEEQHAELNQLLAVMRLLKRPKAEFGPFEAQLRNLEQ